VAAAEPEIGDPHALLMSPSGGQSLEAVMPVSPPPYEEGNHMRFSGREIGNHDSTRTASRFIPVVVVVSACLCLLALVIFAAPQDVLPGMPPKKAENPRDASGSLRTTGIDVHAGTPENLTFAAPLPQSSSNGKHSSSMDFSPRVGTTTRRPTGTTDVMTVSASDQQQQRNWQPVSTTRAQEVHATIFEDASQSNNGSLNSPPSMASEQISELTGVEGSESIPPAGPSPLSDATPTVHTTEAVPALS